jgi:hypothetical protein
MVEFQKRFRNSARTVDSAKIVSGDRPSERQPSQGLKSTQGIRLPCITFGRHLEAGRDVQ